MISLNMKNMFSRKNMSKNNNKIIIKIKINKNIRKK